MKEIIMATILGVVQGVTEFLPVSSDGHLALFHHFLDYKKGDLFFDVALHLATFIVVLKFFGAGFLQILKDTKSEHAETRQYARHVLTLGIIGTIPAGIFGILAKNAISHLSGSGVVVAILLIINGGILLLPKFIAVTADWNLQRFTGVRAMLVGVAQAAAILPGISRSGSTITIAQLLKLNPQDAARFSFYLFIPAVAGAVLLEGIDLLKGEVQVDWTPLACGFVAAMVVGYFSLKVLMRTLINGKFYRFGYYCLGLGVLSLGFFLISA